MEELSPDAMLQIGSETVRSKKEPIPEDLTLSQEGIIAMSDEVSSSSSDVEILEKESLELAEHPDSSFIRVKNFSFVPEYSSSPQDVTKNEVAEKSKAALNTLCQSTYKLNSTKILNAFKNQIEYYQQSYSFTFFKKLIGIFFIFCFIHCVNKSNFDSTQSKLRRLEIDIQNLENFQMECLALGQEEAKAFEKLVAKQRENTLVLKFKTKRLAKSLNSLETAIKSKKTRQKEIIKRFSPKVTEWKEIVDFNEKFLDDTSRSYKALQGRLAGLRIRTEEMRRCLEKGNVSRNLTEAESENRRLRSVLEGRKLQTAKTVAYLEHKLGNLTSSHSPAGTAARNLARGIRARLGEMGDCEDKLRSAISLYYKQFL